MPASDFKLGGIQKIVAGSARPGLIFRRDSLFLGVNPAKTPGRQSPVISPIVTHIVNLSITSGNVPDDFKIAKVTPLYKKNDKLDVGNYRPVSVLSAVSKFLEKQCMYKLKNIY